MYLVLFSPLDYMTLSYTSIGLMCALLMSYLLFALPTQNPFFSRKITAAFTFLWLVFALCCPTMAGAYILLGLLSLVGSVWQTRKATGYYWRNLWKIYRYSTLVLIVAAVAYLYVFVFSRADISTIVNSIPHLFEDPEHQNVDLTRIIRSVYDILAQDNKKYIWICGLAFLIAFIPQVRRLRAVIFGVCTVFYLHAQYVYVTETMRGKLNGQMLYVVFLGAVAFALLKKRPYKLFLTFYGVSAAYTVFNNLTSNTGIMAIAMTLSVGGAAGILCMVQLLKEAAEERNCNRVEKYGIIAAVIVALLMQGGAEGYTRLHRTYWDSDFTELTKTIEVGAARGLKTTDARADTYETGYHNLQTLLDQTGRDGKTFMSCTMGPFYYLDANLPFATFSAWILNYGDGLNDRYLVYKSVNSDFDPDLIYCGSEEDILPFIGKEYHQLEYNGAYLFYQ